MVRQAAWAAGDVLAVDPKPRFELSPYLFMQFMEPLGATDASLSAAWDAQRHSWRQDLVQLSRELAPTLLRWPGGCLSSYYRWQEGVGPWHRRVPMVNLLWGGVETNQVGTHEFVDFCRQVGADPLIAVNFESDGRARWAHPPNGSVRSAGPAEAAAWVTYCNRATHPERERNGAAAPFGVPLWQIGNETSYDPEGFDPDTASQRTLAFARAMHDADPDIALIGWGDSGWARAMLDVVGPELEYLSFHCHFGSALPDSPLQWTDYRRDPVQTWAHLMSAWQVTEARLQQMRQEVAGSHVSLALTESHFALPGRNRCDVLATWAAGVANARVLHVHQRHGDLLKIATLADFCGTRWMNNGVLIPMPSGQPYMMPVARVMSLYRRHIGRQAVEVLSVPDGLDAVASRSGDQVFLHVVNTQRTAAVSAEMSVDGMRIRSGRVFQIALDPDLEVDPRTDGQFAPTEYGLPGDNGWRFPPASVTAIELELQDDLGSGV